ncbi:MAG: exosortase H-associated membrane protein [Betaproteobacteria bacterium]
MPANAMPLKKFVIHTFLWLPPSFAVWYFSAPYLVAVVGKLARLLVNQLTTDVVSAIEQTGSVLLFVTTIKVHPTPEQTALLLPEVNALIYSYGLALFLALMLAEGARWWKFLVGVLILLLFQSWGVAFDLLMQLGIRLGPDVSAAAGLSGWKLEVIALGYQLGALIFPCLAPVMLWVAFSQLFAGGFSIERGQNQGESEMNKHQH